MQRCVELHNPSSQNQKDLISMNAYYLKLMLDIAPHDKNFREKYPTWNRPTKNSARLRRSGEINPDQDTPVENLSAQQIPALTKALFEKHFSFDVQKGCRLPNNALLPLFLNLRIPLQRSEYHECTRRVTSVE